MSTTDDSIADRRDQTSPGARDVLGMVRHMAVTLTDGAFWQVVGHLLIDNRTREAKPAEPFSGVGFYSRPAPGANVEAIVVHAGGAQNPKIVATRDEDLRRRVFPTSAPMAQDEAAAFNTKAMMYITSASKVIACLVGHAASAAGLAKTSELNNLRAFVMQQFSVPGHTHTLVSGGTVTTGVAPVVLPVVAPAAAYPGTTVLQGE